MMLLPFACMPVLAGLGHPGAWLAVLALPLAMKLVRQLRTGLSGPPLNLFLARTAQCALAFAVLLAIGVLF
jgi:1,4-dihydroxy-2-naphthoate octaprenyltransferase